ncbi:MAG: phosphatase PAP2 family protein [Gemmatimonadales bacterium]
MWSARGPHYRLLLAVAILIQPVGVAAQTEVVPPADQSAPIRWWHGAVVLGGLSALLLLDQPAQDFFQDNRSTHSNDVAAALRHFGQPEVYGTVTLGLVGAGLISGNHEVTRAGGRLAASLALAGAAATGLKLAAGRPRPNESLDSDGFDPFSGQDALPSGHTTVAFALATSLADDIHRTWASVGLYTIAGGVGWSRLNDNKHWLSDVALGAVLGVTSAKLVNGHWRIFNLHPPRVLIGPGHAALAWQVSF